MCLKICKPERVKIKDGRTILIRRPMISDAKSLRDYINSLVEEDAPILMNEKISLKQEKEWLKDLLKDIRKGTSHYLVAELDGEIVGGIHMYRRRYRNSHCADIGISLSKDYRRLGIATVLFEKMLAIGKKDKSIKIIYLSAYAYNKKALRLYRKMGFRVVARLKKRVQYKGGLGDELVLDYKG